MAKRKKDIWYEIWRVLIKNQLEDTKYHRVFYARKGDKLEYCYLDWHISGDLEFTDDGYYSPKGNEKVIFSNTSEKNLTYRRFSDYDEKITLALEDVATKCSQYFALKACDEVIYKEGKGELSLDSSVTTDREYELKKF